ncbi:MAG: hypothetical protein QM501_10490 [Gimesia sp.]
MAINENDREDMMREATAFFPRAELRVEHESNLIFWGQKKNGHFSFYFGGDPVYQFDQHGCLRRAFLDGALYRTQGNRLARLNRERNSNKSILKRQDLTITETAVLLEEMSNRFHKLDFALSKQTEIQFLRFLSDGTSCELAALFQNQVQQVLQHSDQLATRIRGKR